MNDPVPPRSAIRPSGVDAPAVRRRLMSRRTFLEVLAAGGAMATGVGTMIRSGSSPVDDGPAGPPAEPGSGGATPGPDGDPVGRLVDNAVGGRVLVIVDLQGGNDGLSTLVPHESGLHHDLRPDLAPDDELLLAVEGGMGLHPSLGRLARRGLLTVEGVGPVGGNLSHFDMTARWQRGDADGTGTRARSGFLGRLTDALDDGSPLVGVALGGPTPHLVNDRAATMSLASAEELWFLQPGDWAEASIYQESLTGLGGGDPWTALVAGSYRQLLDLAERMTASGHEVDWEHPMLADGGELGWQLYVAADVLAAQVGTRVVYTAVGGYDTHSGHRWQAEANLAQVDAAVDGFLARIEEQGLADRVVVATISEFGRRVPQNGSGLDHGNASTMLLAGAVTPARAGDRPPLDDLDDDGNLRTTIGFDRYLATLAQEWLGVEAASVLPGEPEPLGLL